MDQCARIKLILQENKLKQKQLAAQIGVTDGYISMLLKDPDINLSVTLATLIEEKYGYNVEWLLYGKEPKLKQISKNRSLSDVHQRALVQLEKMSESQAKAVLAFIHSLEDVEKIFKTNEN